MNLRAHLGQLLASRRDGRALPAPACLPGPVSDDGFVLCHCHGRYPEPLRAVLDP